MSEGAVKKITQMTIPFAFASKTQCHPASPMYSRTLVALEYL